MKKLSTANLLSIHVLILRIFVSGGATRIVGAGSRQSQIGLCTVVLLANPLPRASGLGNLTTTTPSPSPGLLSNGILNQHHHHFHASDIKALYTDATYTDDNIVHEEW